MLAPLLYSSILLTLSSRGVQWPGQLDNPSWRPHIGYLREATAIAGQRLEGPRVLWNGDGAVQWSLADAPAGMQLGANNKIEWASPAEGRYLVRLQAHGRNGTEETDWYLNVLRTEPGVDDPVVCSMRHIDYIVPRSYSDWIKASGAAGVIDRYYEFGRDLVGGYPSDARQSMIWTPSMGGAHSGDPIVSGPFTFGDNDANKWRLGFLFHELGHDLNAWTWVGPIEHGEALADGTLHDMVEFDKIAWVMRMLKAPDQQGVANVPKFVEWMKYESMEFVADYEKYLSDVHTGADYLHWNKAQSAAWAGMVHEYAFRYGGDALERVIRAIRRDGINELDYPPGCVTAGQRLTLIMCLMSGAAGHDLKKDFVANGFPIDEAVYTKFRPVVAKAMANLPPMAVNGMIRCPVDGHYYSVTPYPTTWVQAESTARRLGGHLATIRSAAQEKWLSNRYANDGWLWVGYRKEPADGKWRWISGETPPSPIWEPERPEPDPAKTHAVLIFHEGPQGPWCGLANRPPDEHLFGIIELDHAPAKNVDSLD